MQRYRSMKNMAHSENYKWSNKNEMQEGRLGVWLAELPTSAQVMISQFVGLSPTLGSLLSAQSPLQILCTPLSAPPLHSIYLSLKNK